MISAPIERYHWSENAPSFLVSMNAMCRRVREIGSDRVGAWIDEARHTGRLEDRFLVDTLKIFSNRSGEGMSPTAILDRLASYGFYMDTASMLMQADPERMRIFYRVFDQIELRGAATVPARIRNLLATSYLHWSTNEILDRSSATGISISDAELAELDNWVATGQPYRNRDPKAFPGEDRRGLTWWHLRPQQRGSNERLITVEPGDPALGSRIPAETSQTSPQERSWVDNASPCLTVNWINEKIQKNKSLIEDPQKQTWFAGLLERLPGTDEARRNPNGLKIRVESLLQALKKEGVKEYSINNLEGAERCSDRTISDFQHLEVAAAVGRFAIANDLKKDQDKFFRFIRGYIYRASLHQFIGEAPEVNTEEIETGLAAEIALGQHYEMPSHAESMLYSRSANQAVIQKANCHLGALSYEQLADCLKCTPSAALFSKLITEKLFPEEYLSREKSLQEAFKHLDELPPDLRDSSYLDASEACKACQRDFVREKLINGCKLLGPLGPANLRQMGCSLRFKGMDE